MKEKMRENESRVGVRVGDGSDWEFSVRNRRVIPMVATEMKNGIVVDQIERKENGFLGGFWPSMAYRP